MASITSTTFDTRSLSGTITIESSSLTNPSAETFTLDDVGIISSEFDLEDTEQEARTIFFNLGEFTFSAFDRMSGGTSLFNRIDTDLSSTDDLTITLNLTINAASSTSGSTRDIDDTFTCKKTDMEYDYERRSVKFKCVDKFEGNTTVDQLFNNNPADVEDYYDTVFAVTEECMSAFDYIGNTLSLINANSTNVRRAFSFPDDQKGASDEAWVLYNSASSAPATLMLYKMAAFDGSIVGSMMGYNFFVNRLDTTAVTLAPSDVKELTVDVGLNDFFTIKAILEGESLSENWQSTYSLIGEADGLNPDSLRRLDVYFFLHDESSLDSEYSGSAELGAGNWDSGNNRYNATIGVGETVSDGVVDGEPQAGDTAISIDDGSGGSATPDLSDGDLIYFGPDTGKLTSAFKQAYEVRSMTGGALVLKEPLVEDVADNSTIRKWNEVENRNDAAQRAAECYAAAYGADGSRRISITVYGIDTVKPYEAFTLNSSFNAPVANATFRPSSISYNLKEDTIDIEAYQIA